MSILLFIVIFIVVVTVGFIAENRLKKYYTIVYKIMWYFLSVSVIYLSIFPAIEPSESWGVDIVVGGLIWVSYIAFSVYISIKCISISNRIAKNLLLLFAMNFLFFFIIADKTITNGNIYFSFWHVLVESIVILVCQLPVCIIVKLVNKKKNKEFPKKDYFVSGDNKNM